MYLPITYFTTKSQSTTLSNNNPPADSPFHGPSRTTTTNPPTTRQTWYWTSRRIRQHTFDTLHAGSWFCSTLRTLKLIQLASKAAKRWVQWCSFWATFSQQVENNFSIIRPASFWYYSLQIFMVLAIKIMQSLYTPLIMPYPNCKSYTQVYEKNNHNRVDMLLSNL